MIYTYGNAHFENVNATLSQVYLNLMIVTQFIYTKMIKCMISCNLIPQGNSEGGGGVARF